MHPYLPSQPCFSAPTLLNFFTNFILHSNLAQPPTFIQLLTYFFICHPHHLCTLIRVSPFVVQHSAQQNMQTLPPQFKYYPNPYIYSTIQFINQPCALIRPYNHSFLVQPFISPSHTSTWIQISPKIPHLPNYPLTFLICHHCQPCAVIICSITISQRKAQQIIQTLASEFKYHPNSHIYSTIQLLFSFVISVNLALPLGFLPPIPGATPNKLYKLLCLNSNITQIHIYTQLYNSFFHLSSLSTLHPH